MRIAPVHASCDDLLLGQKPCKCSGGRRLASASVAANEHTADQRVDDIDEKRELEPLLPDDSRQWETAFFHRRGGLLLEH